MFNTKNLIILAISTLLAALLTLTLDYLIPLGQLPAYLLCGLLAGLLVQILPGIKLPSLNIPSLPKRERKSTPQNKLDPNRETGTVKWFDSSKGYGFITRSMGEDIFVHFRSIQGNGYRSLYEGQAVDFLITKGSRGPQAEDIHIIE